MSTHIWKYKHSHETQVTRIICESVTLINTFHQKSFICDVPQSQGTPLSVIPHSEGHINKLMYSSSSWPPQQISQSSPSTKETRFCQLSTFVSFEVTFLQWEP